MASKNMDDIAKIFEGLKFKKTLVGGYDPADVWKQLEMLQHEYRSAYEAKEIEYQALLSWIVSDGESDDITLADIQSLLDGLEDSREGRGAGGYEQ